jgi:hypothetical protein
MILELIKINGVDRTVCVTVPEVSTFSFDIKDGFVMPNHAQRLGAEYTGMLDSYQKAYRDAFSAYRLGEGIFDKVTNKT